MKARPTVYNGIQMRSRLEAGYAAWLDEQGFKWEYEPHAFAGPKGQYLPDFMIRDVFTSWTMTRRDLYVEVKPNTFDVYEDDEGFDVVDRLGVIRDSDPYVALGVAQPGNDPDDPEELVELAMVYTDVIEPGRFWHWPRPAVWVEDPERDYLALAAPIYEGPWWDRYWEGPRHG